MESRLDRCLYSCVLFSPLVFLVGRGWHLQRCDVTTAPPTPRTDGCGVAPAIGPVVMMAGGDLAYPTLVTIRLTHAPLLPLPPPGSSAAPATRHRLGARLAQPQPQPQRRSRPTRSSLPALGGRSFIQKNRRTIRSVKSAGDECGDAAPPLFVFAPQPGRTAHLPPPTAILVPSTCRPPTTSRPSPAQYGLS